MEKPEKPDEEHRKKGRKMQRRVDAIDATPLWATSVL